MGDRKLVLILKFIWPSFSSIIFDFIKLLGLNYLRKSDSEVQWPLFSRSSEWKLTVGRPITDTIFKISRKYIINYIYEVERKDMAISINHNNKFYISANLYKHNKYITFIRSSFSDYIYSEDRTKTCDITQIIFDS